MKLFKKFRILLLILPVVFFTLACSSDDSQDPDEPIELSLANIVGRWGISQTSVDGTNQTKVPCKNTVELEANGDYLIIDAEKGEWRSGNASFTKADSILTMTSSATGGTLRFKLISVSEEGFVLQHVASGASGLLPTDQFVKLEDGDCAAMTSAQLQNKWSVDELERSAYEITEGDIGDLIGTEAIDDIPYNRFTIEFKDDGSFIMVDLVLELRYGIGTYERLDDHNILLSFDDDDQNEQTLFHLTSFTEGVGASFLIAEDDDQDDERILTEFDLVPNDGSEPTVTDADLEGKWSAASIAERAFLNGQTVDEEVIGSIPHNKLTLEFFDDRGVQLIDLVQEVGFRRGEYMLLDPSNILLKIGDDEEFELFHVISASAGAITVKSFEGRDDHDDGNGGDGTGEANNDHDTEYDRREFELSLNKNSGDEPSTSEDDLIGQWEVTEVENLGDQGSGGNDEGPQVGMILTFVNNGTGEVTFNGNVVVTFEYELIDENNVQMIFSDSGGQGEGDLNIVHVMSVPTGALEVVFYVPAEVNADGSTGDEGGPAFRVVMEKQ